MFILLPTYNLYNSYNPCLFSHNYNLYLCNLCNLWLSTEEQHDNLRREDPQEHRQRIDRRVPDGRRLFRADTVRIGQCRGIGIRTRDHTRNGEVIELIPDPGDRSYDEDRNDRD